MPKLSSDNQLFLLNALLVAGLIVMGPLARQSDTEGMPLTPAVQNPIAAAPANVPAATNASVAQSNTPILQTGNPATSTPQALVPPPIVRHRSDDERGGE